MKTFTRHLGRLGGQQGFTLPELTMTIALMGLLFAVASSTWFGVIEGRSVTSAANQTISEMRLAHTKATNRLEVWTLKYGTNAALTEYEVGREGGIPVTRSLPEGTRFSSTGTVRFTADRRAEALSGGTIIRVESTDDTGKFQRIEFNEATSRVQVVG